MLSIGDLARHTRVSVRMLRHYDALGLVTPEQVDECTGYRWYASSQSGRVNSLLALKELGFTLEQCRTILDEEVSVEQLRGMNDATEISALVGSLFDTLSQRLADAGVPVAGRGIRTYYGRPDGSKIDIAAGLPVGSDVGPIDGVQFVELPAEATAAAVIHRGPVAEIADAWQTFDVGIEQRGMRSYGTCRQIYLETPVDSDHWVVELQVPVRGRGEDTCPAASQAQQRR